MVPPTVLIRGLLLDPIPRHQDPDRLPPIQDHEALRGHPAAPAAPIPGHLPPDLPPDLLPGHLLPDLHPDLLPGHLLQSLLQKDPQERSKKVLKYLLKL